MKKLITILLLFSSFNIYAQQAGNALDFDGTNDYANGSGISTSLTNITLEAWVYHHILPPLRQRYVTIGNEVAVIRHDGASQQGQLHFYVKVGGSLHHIRVDNVLQTGQWYHVVGTLTYAFPYSNMKLYLNGEWVGTKMNIFGPLNTPNGNVQISRPAEVMDGYIDEVRIWNDARSPEEIRANMYKTLTGTETGLENYWMFNESSGSTAYDNSGSVNLTLNNMTDDDWVVSGAFTGPRNTLEFDGIDECVSVPDNDNLDLTTTYTLEAWIKPASFGNIKGIIGKYHTPGSNGYLLRLHNISPYSGLCFDQLYTSTGILEANHWYHIAAINDNGTRKLYLNGAEQTLSGTPLSVQANSDPLCIGVDYLTSGRYFDGKIDEVRIWNDVRTPAEIRENMCQTLAGNESGLVAYYRFDQEEGTTLYDLTSNGNDGTLTNMADNDWVSSNAFNTWIGCAGTDWATGDNWSQGTAPDADSVNVGIPNYTGGNQAVMDGNFTCNNLVVGTGSDFTINSGKILTINGNAFIPGSQSGAGIIELTGASASHTIAGTFNNIELDEFDGADMEGNAIINGTLTLTNGVLSIGANTLFLNGVISTTSGSLSGGSSSNITFGGSGASTDLPAVSLGKLTINRTNGIGLSGDVTIDDTLTLTSGSLNLNSYALVYGPGSTLNYNSTSGPQTTASSEFPVTDGPHNLLISNTSGVNLAFNRTINGTLILDDGVFSIGDNTLTLNGAISTTSGSLTGGSSSNITFGGSGDSTGLPAVSLGKLTINRANGIGLAGDVIIDDTLTLTNGALSIDANTLTLSGVISTTSGSLSGGSFSNITFSGLGISTDLPAVSLGNLTINRANGIGLAGDVTINDTLKLTDGALSIDANTLTLDGAISTTSGSISGGSSSNITFAGSGDSTGLPAVSLGKLTINRANGIGLAGDVTIDDTLKLTDGALSIDANTLTLNGVISTTSGSLSGGSSSNVNFGGSGDSTGLPAVSLGKLTINRANGIGLAGDVTIDDTLKLTDGALSIDANTLTLNGVISTTSGSLSGGSFSNITFSGLGISTDLPAVSLGNLTINRANGIGLAGDVTINDTLTLTDGALSIDANTLTLDGAISTTSGSLSGGSSSNITFGGSGASTDLPAISLGKLTINRANGIGLAGDVTIDDTLKLTDGALSIDANTLTLNGAISTTSGSLSGGSSSNITFGGSGASTELQAISLGNLTINRANGIGMVGDVTINDILTLTDGQFYVGLNTLTIKNAIAGTPANLVAVGYSSITIAGSGSGVNIPSSVSALRNLVLNNSNGTILQSDIIIIDMLTLTNGDLDLNGDTLTLGSYATLSESIGNTVKGDSGIIITTRTFNTWELSSGINIAGLGAEITTDAGLGEITIIRGHATQIRDSIEGILRYYDIDPANNSGLDATLTFHYDDTELNGITAESQLELFRSTDTGNTWSAEGGEVNTANNTIILSGIDAFSRWTSFTTGFTQVVSLTGVSGSVTCWGDYDNDGDLDILLTGWDENYDPISRIYRNDGNENFTDINAGLTGVSGSVACWGDYDNDGDLDILLTGFDENYDPISRIYRNDGNENFTDINAGLTGVYWGSVAWGDYDNDGDLDILLTGNSSTGYISRIYRNDSSGTFTDIEAGLISVDGSSVAWGDYDNDGDLDIMLTGRILAYVYISRVYRNDGSGTFTDINAGLTGVMSGSVAWGDYDNDGDLDILLTGDSGSGCISRVYRNDSIEGFTDINAGLTGVYIGGVAWGDYDNDGDLDILLTGGYIISLVYRNDGYDTFTNINAGLISVQNSSVAWGDYDNDGDLDILLTGRNYDNDPISRVYRNNILDANTAPGTPANLSASISSDKVSLSWDKSTDNETPQNALTYNLRIGTSSGGVQTASPMADVSNGYRKVAALGNTNHNNNWDIYGLIDNSTYYWSVQAVDNAFAGSAFATEGSFVIPDYPNISTTSITNITTTTASSGGNVTDEGTFPVTVKGIVWDTCKNPTVDTYTGKTNNGSGLGSFISSLTGLAGGQTYYVRAYATNSEYTAYGGQKVFATPMKPPGNALDFDGIDDYVGIPDNGSLDLTDSLTIEAWIKADLWKANIWEGSIIVKDGDQSGYMLRCGDNGKVNFNIGTGAWNDLTTDEADSLSLNIWYHIAATYDGTTQKIYVNGVLVKEQSTSGAVVVNPYSLMIGKSPAYPDRRYAGKIDEVRIWNIARNSVQIRKNMHRTLNGDEDNLVAYYRFDHISGTALSDRTSNDNDGTLHNMDDTDWVSSTAPIPYFTVYDGNWEVDSVWAAGQNAPVYQWSRVKIKHNITLNSNMELLELIIDTNAIMTISTGDTLTVGGQ